jgi:hypothetical protein
MVEEADTKEIACGRWISRLRSIISEAPSNATPLVGRDGARGGEVGPWPPYANFFNTHIKYVD